MTGTLESLLVEFDGLPPASTGQISKMEELVSATFPSDFKNFLLVHNGGEGFVGRHYLSIWGTETLPNLNKAYEVSTYAPGLVFFGSTGGGDGFAFDIRSDRSRVMQVPFIGMSLEDGFEVASSFDELLLRMKMTPGSLF